MLVTLKATAYDSPYLMTQFTALVQNIYRYLKGLLLSLHQFYYFAIMHGLCTTYCHTQYILNCRSAEK